MEPCSIVASNWTNAHRTVQNRPGPHRIAPDHPEPHGSPAHATPPKRQR